MMSGILCYSGGMSDFIPLPLARRPECGRSRSAIAADESEGRSELTFDLLFVGSVAVPVPVDDGSDNVEFKVELM